jgi:hypothetical protein
MERMNRNAREVPLADIQRALVTTTERLAHELGSAQVDAPEWSAFEWDVARAAAAMQGISMLLAAQLRWQGNDAWQAFLARQCLQSAKRHTRALQVLATLDEKLRARGVAAVALKGAALTSLGIYAPGARPMGDLDLLVAPDQLAAAADAVLDAGYRNAFDTRRHRAFVPREMPTAFVCGEHADNPLKIEVHTRIAEKLPVEDVDVTDCIFPAQPHAGLNDYRDIAGLMRHLLLHAAGNMRANALRHIQLHDIALLAPRLATADWNSLTATPGAAGGNWWMLPPLALVARYYPASIPADVSEDLRRHCPRRLHVASTRQRVSDVSWSNARIGALPGWKWSRTWPELLRYVRSRALPSRIDREELGVGMQSQRQLLATRWYGVSHAERLARFVFARPARVQTMMSVRAALNSEL